MTFHVFVDGQEGTTGLRIHEYLAQRTDIEVLRIAADKRKDVGERARLLNAADQLESASTVMLAFGIIGILLGEALTDFQ